MIRAVSRLEILRRSKCNIICRVDILTAVSVTAVADVVIPRLINSRAKRNQLAHIE